MFDSSIRLKQLNQPELSGFISGIVSSFPETSTSGNIIPSGSGLYNLGSSQNPYQGIYTNQLNLPYGSGINFGGTIFNAYISGGVSYVDVGGLLISSSGENIYIQGPQGIAGPSGALGPSGSTGISVTGIYYNTSTYNIYFQLSNNTQTGFYFPPFSGASGVGITGFYQSGYLIFPEMDHFRGTGAPLILPAGPPGPPGSISLYFESGDLCDPMPQVNFPSQVTINPYYETGISQSISLMRGMAYTMNSSGLNTHIISSLDYSLLTGIFSGQISNVPNVGTSINYYEDPNNGTGYWRLAFFPMGTQTGFYDSVDNPSIFNQIETTNTQVYGSSLIGDIYRTYISFTTEFTASGCYQYGFVTYGLGIDTTTDAILSSPSTGYAIVCGTVYVSSGIGPVGPAGPSGLQGPVGEQGNIGPMGLQGNQGLSVESYNQQQIGPNSYQIQFIFSDGSLGPWIALPSGGPSGLSGAMGLPGSLTNYFEGNYYSGTVYTQNSTVSFSGSTYIDTGSSPISGTSPPNVPWQLLAQQGGIGPSGATGIADKYSSSFLVNYNNTGIIVNSVNISGTGAIFQIGQTVQISNPSLSGYAYTPFQNIVVSSNTVTGTYFYGLINSYNNTGVISFNVLSGFTGIVNNTVSGNYILFYNFGDATINLGANLMLGAVGPVGPIGPQGPSGQPSVMRNGVYIGSSGMSFTFEPSGLDVFNLLITGDGTQYYGNSSVLIDFDYNYWTTGKAVIVKIRNSGIPYGNQEPPLYYFQSLNSGVNNFTNQIKWPGGVYSRPDDGEAFLFTLLRFPDEFGSPAIYGTYSNTYR